MPATVKAKNVESETKDTLDPEVLLGVLPTEVAFFDKPTYKVRIGIEVNKSALYSKTCLVDQSARPNNNRKNYRSLQWNYRIKSLYAPKAWTETKESFKVQGLILLAEKMGALQARMWFSVVERLARAILRSITYTDPCIRGLFPMDRKICQYIQHWNQFWEKTETCRGYRVHPRTRCLVSKWRDMRCIQSQNSYQYQQKRNFLWL